MHSNRRGADAIEYALTLPVLLLVLYGVMEFGWYFYDQSSVSDAVHGGCRQGSLVSPVTDDPEQVAIDAISDGLAGHDVEGLGVEIVGEPPDEQLRCGASVRATTLIGFIPSPGWFQVEETMRLEIQR